MTKTDMSPEAVTARIRKVGDDADLRTERRLDSKVDMSRAGVSQRIAKVGGLRHLCVGLGRRR